MRVYAVGICAASVCVEKDATPKEIEREVNARHPTGVTPWAMSEDATFKGGEPNPCPCPDEPDRVHYLLNC